MRDPSTWSGLWPEQIRDRMAFTAVVVGAPLMCLFEILLILPQSSSFGSRDHLFYGSVFILLLVNFMGNLYKVISIDPSGRDSDLPSVLWVGWRYCYICKLNAPPRAYHCSVCDICVLKRDHHCSFAGTCIGYRNHRYYIAACLYAWFGCLFALYWHWAFIWEYLGGFRPVAVWYVLMPHMALLTLQVGPLQCILAMIQMGSVTTVGLTTYMIGTQVFGLLRGQTREEFLQGVRAYDMGFYSNLREAMGRQWFLAVLSPFLRSELPGNGLKFQARVEIGENVKDM